MKFLFILFFSPLPFINSAQNVEIQGRAKITVMDTVNTATNLVVRQPNGVLATRLVSTLDPPGSSDTTRSFERDLLLVLSACQCGAMSPFIITSALNNGYSVLDLAGAGAKYNDLVAAGYTIPELVAEGYTVALLLQIGAPVSALLAAGITPFAIYQAGAPYVDIMGQSYGGGLIFYLNTGNGTGLISSLTNLPNSEWGCYGTLIPGADGVNIGTGNQNTTDIDVACTTPTIAADRCINLVLNSYSDWFLPSLNELLEMYNKIGPGAPAPNTNVGNFTLQGYWSSSENNNVSAKYFLMSNGSTNIELKNNSIFNVRAIRPF
jgi:hypothetical protein